MLESLVLSVTYQCPIRCKYCGVKCGPHRTERMSLELMKRLIDEVALLETSRLVVFTGGEPLTLGEDLFQAIRYATQKGFVTRVVSNAYWAKTPEAALSTMIK